MDKFIADYKNGRIGFSVADSRGRELGYNHDSSFPLASAVKIPICAEAYRQMSSNAISPYATLRLTESKKSPGSGNMQDKGDADFEVRELIHFMMQTSDNIATDMILELIGFDSVRKLTEPYEMDIVMEMRPWFLIVAGLAGEFREMKADEIAEKWKEKSYAEKRMSVKRALEENEDTPFELLKRSYYDRREEAMLGIALENFAKPRLFNRFVLDLYSDRFGQSTREGVLEAMDNAESYINDALSTKHGLRVYSKPGEIEGATADAGIILMEGHPEWHMAMSLFITDAQDTKQAELDMPKIAEICYEYIQKQE